AGKCNKKCEYRSSDCGLGGHIASLIISRSKAHDVKVDFNRQTIPAPVSRNFQGKKIFDRASVES
ncbi:MAG TPA: hypothetical protein VJ417_05495, partial [Candidatus Glassbacteria bacterium]|nr:hypothetical protein [Candidatus Glassbacteria bacterium]